MKMRMKPNLWRAELSCSGVTPRRRQVEANRSWLRAGRMLSTWQRPNGFVRALVLARDHTRRFLASLNCSLATDVRQDTEVLWSNIGAAPAENRKLCSGCGQGKQQSCRGNTWITRAHPAVFSQAIPWTHLTSHGNINQTQAQIRIQNQNLFKLRVKGAQTHERTQQKCLPY